jgi:hypothetical protein
MRLLKRALRRPAQLLAQRILTRLGEMPARTFVRPGHFYSPIPDTADLASRGPTIFDRTRRPAGIDLNEAHQLDLLRRLGVHYASLPFAPERPPGMSYAYENPNFSYGDAIVYAGMLMEFRPRRVIEVGSGHSSAALVDIDRTFLGGATEITCIEPYPALLQSLLPPAEFARIRVIPSPVQGVDLSVFTALEAGDILFIDSTHVSKCGSDVNFELFEVLPILPPGVIIHFHDMFYPFEYPEDWVLRDNRAWNELYVMRAFLADNARYGIEYFNDFIAREHRALLEATLPLALRNTGGGLWLRKLG